MVEELFRTGGETVFVNRDNPNGISFEEYSKLIQETPKARFWGWSTRRINMDVYGRGKVSHRDHKTVILKDWHRVLPNRESNAWFIEESLRFLD